jgi:hypothetical protein
MGVDGDSPSPELGLEGVPAELVSLKPGLGWARRLGLKGSREEHTAEQEITFWVSSVRIML